MEIDAPTEKRSHAWTRRAPAIVALAVVVAGAWLARRVDPSVRVEAFDIERAKGARTPALRVAPAGPRRATALLAHGVLASKETLFLIGEALARQGVECVLVDFPGHGASREGFERAELVTVLADAARALGGRPDVVVGHSMGAYVLARAVESGQVPRPRLFVAIGAVVDVVGDRDPVAGGSCPLGDRALLCTGRFDLLARPTTIELYGSLGPNVEFVIGRTDHVLEPFDPVLVESIVGAALRALSLSPWVEPGPSPTAAGRALGGLLLLAAAPVLLVLALRRRASATTRTALADGARAAALIVLLGLLALDGPWLSIAPRARNLPWLVVFALGAGGLPWLVGRALARIGPRAARAEVVLAQGAMALGLLAAALVTSGFTAMMLGVFALVAAVAAGVGAWVSRRAGHPLAGHVVFGVVLGYGPALCAPVLLR